MLTCAITRPPNRSPLALQSARMGMTLSTNPLSVGKWTVGARTGSQSGLVHVPDCPPCAPASNMLPSPTHCPRTPARRSDTPAPTLKELGLTHENIKSAVKERVAANVAGKPAAKKTKAPAPDTPASAGGRRRKTASALPNQEPVLSRGFGSTTVYDRLRKEILNLGLPPGTLLDETEIAQRFGLSRSPVREALIRLSAEGLVVTLRNRSSIVAPFDIASVPSYVDATRLLYRLTSRLAALNRTAPQMANIRRLCEEHLLASQLNYLEPVVSLNREFHVAIAEASGNAYFGQWTRTLLDQGQRILATYLQDLDLKIPTGTLDEHQRLVDAIEARDADAAESAGARDADILSHRLSQRLQARRVSDFALHPHGAAGI